VGGSHGGGSHGGLNLLFVAAGGGLVLLGAVVLRGSLQRLARVGVFGSVFWHSFGDYSRYRRRALRPAVLALCGVVSVLAGLILAGSGIVGYYSDHLGHRG
jgi:hypothetical protein